MQCNPIREITGEAMFCEVVFTDARVPAAYRLGEEGDGWNVAMGTLTHERAGTGGIAIGLRAELEQMIRAAREHNPDALARPRHPRPHRPHVRPGGAHPAAQRPGAVQGAEGRAAGSRRRRSPSSSGATCRRRWPSSNVDLLGPLGILAKGGPDTVDGGHAAHNYPWQRFTSIGAGATEVQKNIIADRAIRLPKR